MNAEDNGELPEGWALCELPNVAEIIMGQSPPGSTYNDDGKGLPFFQGKADFGQLYPTVRKWCTAPTKVAQAGDILISIRAPVGPTNIATEKCAIGRGLSVIRARESIENGWLLYALRLQEPQLAEQGTGSTFTAINREHLDAFELPLPPLAEQRRIVAAVEAVLAKVNAARERLNRVPAILKRFRQAVLSAACSGRLTADWREKNLAIESATTLVQRIAELRQTKPSEWRRFASRVVQTGSEDAPIEEPDEVELPEPWLRCGVEQIATVCLGGTPSRKVNEYWDGDVLWVSSGEVANCRITTTSERITQDGLENSNAKVYPPGTVLIAMIGEGKTRGQTALLDVTASTNQNVAGLVFDAENMVSEYVWYWALSVYETHRSGGRGGNYPALNGQIIRKFEIPVPPLGEQQEIVRRVGELFALADVIEARLTDARRMADQLTQAVLAKAFRGELVPTEAALARRENRAYEPASELLARIRAEREQPAAPAKPARKPSRTAGTGGN